MIHVRLPVQGVRAEPFVSATGKRLVWRVRSSIERLRVESLWVSRLDGTDTRKIVEVEQQAPSWDLAFREVAWLPDEKHISFVYGNALWTMFVD